MSQVARLSDTCETLAEARMLIDQQEHQIQEIRRRAKLIDQAKDDTVTKGQPPFEAKDLWLIAPACVQDTYTHLCHELAKKQGIIDTLSNPGLAPDEVVQLERATRDRDAIVQALGGLRTLYQS